MIINKKTNENFDIVTYNDAMYVKFLKADENGNAIGDSFKDGEGNAITPDSVKNFKADCDVSIPIDINTTVSDNIGNVYAVILSE